MKESEQQQIFENWIRDYKGVLFKVVRAYAYNTYDQEDLFQDIAIQVWQSIPNFQGKSAVTTWLYRISFNTALKWTNKSKRHRHGRQSIEDVKHILKQQAKPMDERLTWLYEEIAHLTELDRSLALLLLDGFSYKEMSKILGLSESNVGVKINRLKKSLITKSQKYDHHGV